MNFWRRDTKCVHIVNKGYKKTTEQLVNNCPIPDLIQAFSEENGGLNQVLRRANLPILWQLSIFRYIDSALTLGHRKKKIHIL